MYSIREIASHINGKIVGDSDLVIKGLCGIDSGKNQHISYLHEKQYLEYFLTTKASAIIVDDKIAVDFKSLSSQIIEKTDKTLIKVDNAAKAFSELIHLFHKKQKINPSISKTAVINESAKLGNNIYIGHNTIIDNDVTIGNNVFIGHGCYIGNNCIIGKDSTLSNNVTLVKNSQLGESVKIDSGSVIGGSGFGLFTKNRKHSLIPHVGNVIIENNVSVGSNSCIDRGTLNDTKIGENTYIDNLVQIAHNVEIGKGCIIAGQTGIAGSSILGDFVTTGGQVGIVGHIKIGNNVTIAGKSLVTKSIASNQTISGNPAKNHKERIKHEATMNRLPDILKNIKK